MSDIFTLFMSFYVPFGTSRLISYTKQRFVCVRFSDMCFDTKKAPSELSPRGLKLNFVAILVLLEDIIMLVCGFLSNHLTKNPA